MNFIASLRQNNPQQILYDVESGANYLYMANNGRHSQTLWVKFGWARRSGLPEKLDVSQGRTEFLVLPSGVYIYEPSHFVIFQHNDRIFLLQEFNFFGPRATGFCNYIIEFYNRINNVQKARLDPRRVFRGDIDKLLREYTIVKSMRIEIVPSALNKLSRALGGSESALDVLRSRNPKRVAITLSSDKGGELELTINDVLRIFSELESDVNSFKVTVKRGLFDKPTKIDLKKQALIFKKPFKCVTDAEGNRYRSTDTDYAVRVLLETVDDVLNVIS